MGYPPSYKNGDVLQLLVFVTGAWGGAGAWEGGTIVGVSGGRTAIIIGVSDKTHSIGDHTTLTGSGVS